MRRFPGVVPLEPEALSTRVPRDTARAREALRAFREAPFLWVEVALGQGGLAWLAAWTSLRLADDPLGRPALWIDTHSTLTPGDLGELEGRLVVVRPADPHEAHVAADIALRAGSFSLVALEMHRALHPTPLSRLARLASARRAGSAPVRAGANEHDAPSHTPLVLWGEPPPFLAPPSGIPRSSFVEVVSALVTDPRLALPEEPHAHDPRFTEALVDDAFRAPHTTDRLRPLDRAADRRPSPPSPRSLRPVVDDAALAPAFTPHDDPRDDRDDEAPFPSARARAR